MVPYPPASRSRRASRRRKAIAVALLIPCTAGLGYGLKKALDARRGRQLIQWGDTAMAAGKFEDAAIDYTRARARYPQDLDLADKCGDALYQASAARPKALFEARSIWQDALSVNPNHLPTLHRLLSLDADFAEIRLTETAFAELGQTASSIAGLAPDDAQAHTLQVIAPLGAWATGHAKTDDKVAASTRESDLAQLSTVLDQNPTDGTALYYEVLALTRRAKEIRATEPATADRYLSQAETRLSAVLKSSDANADSLYRTAQGFLMVAQAHTQDTAASSTLLARAQDASAKAAALTKPHDHDYVPLCLLQSQIALAQGDPAAARVSLKDTLAQRPDAMPVRIALAELLNSSDLEAAIQLLDQGRTIPCTEPGPAALAHQASVVDASILEAALCVNAASVTDDPNVRPERIDRAQAAVDGALADAANNPAALKASARLHLLKGQYVDAIRTADLAAKNSRPTGAVEDPDLSHIKALAFWSLHEPQEAMTELDTALAANPALVPHRLLRAKILLAQGKISEAADQAEMLRQKNGSDPAVAQLLLDVQRAQATADPSPQRTQAVNQSYADLPESDAMQRRQKAQQAVALGNLKDAIRLLQPNAAADSVPDTIALAEVLVADHQTDRATAAVDDALRAHPRDAQLLYAKKKLSGATPDELKKYAEELSRSQDDPFTADLLAARTALLQKNPAQARAALDRARAIKPDDPDFLDMDFHCDLLEHQWDAAQHTAEKLAATNRDQTNGLYYQFELAMARQDAPAATAIATTLTNRFDQFAQSWVALGLALQAGNKPAESRDAFQRAWSLEPTNLHALRGLAACCFVLQRDTETDSWIQQGLKIAPDDRELRGLQSRRYFQRISAQANAKPPAWDQVEQLLAEARAASPEDPNWDALESRMWWARADAAKAAPLMHQAELLAEKRHFSRTEVPAQTAQLLAMVRDELLMLLAAHQEDAAATEAKRLIERFGNAGIASAWAHVANAIRLHRLSATDPAVATELDAAMSCAKSVGDVPSGTDVLSTIDKEVSPADALRAITAYGSAAPSTANDYDKDPRWDIARAGLLDQLGDLSAASPIVDSLMPNLEKLPPPAQILLLRLAADIYSKSQPAPQSEKAKNAYTALLTRVPDDLPALNNLACILLDQIKPPQPQQALTYSQKAYDILSRAGRYDPQIADTFGWSLANNGQYSQAIEILEEVVMKIPSAQTQDHLGETYLMAGRPADALPHLAAALKLLDTAEHHGTPPDPALRSRIQDAQQHAAEMKPASTTAG
jgi:predicted Zn-dependent protease